MGALCSGGPGCGGYVPPPSSAGGSRLTSPSSWRQGRERVCGQPPRPSPRSTHAGWAHGCWLQRRRMGLGLFLWSHRCRWTRWWSRRLRQPYLVNWIPEGRTACRGGQSHQAPTVLPRASGTVSSGETAADPPSLCASAPSPPQVTF